MSECGVVWYSRRRLNDPVAVVGFPSVGLVGSIVASFVVKQLGLEPVAGIVSPDLPPYTLVQNSVPLAPVRVYAGPASKAPAKDAAKKGAKAPARRDLVVVTSEIAPKPEQTYEVAERIAEVLVELGVRETVCLEGVPENPENSGQYLGVGSTPEARRLVKRAGVPVMEEGIVRGVSGVMLCMGAEAERDVVCLLCPANPQLPDPGAAAGSLTPLSKIVKGLSVDTKPLTEEAESIDSRIREQQAKQSSGPENIYG